MLVTMPQTRVTILLITLSAIPCIADDPPAPKKCIILEKETSYQARYFKYDYREAKIKKKGTEAHQKMFCLEPTGVIKMKTRVCDKKYPTVRFSLGDEYVNIKRVEEIDDFATVKTYQVCSHRLNPGYYNFTAQLPHRRPRVSKIYG